MSVRDIEDRIKSYIDRTEVDTSYSLRPQELVERSVRKLATSCPRVLDVGKSSREFFKLFAPGQATTLDINQWDGYPDIVDDLCDPQRLTSESFDGIVCLAVLEHVYDPFAAVRTLHSTLKPGGSLFAYTPFLWRYHAPEDLKYKDMFRFTRDGLCYMLRDFSQVKLYTVRGRHATILNLMPWWKYYVERKLPKLGRVIDGARSSSSERLQVSGYYIWAVK